LGRNCIDRSKQFGCLLVRDEKDICAACSTEQAQVFGSRSYAYCVTASRIYREDGVIACWPSILHRRREGPSGQPTLG
jgi:hypothetical protein